jgi:hypothetical protein
MAAVQRLPLPPAACPQLSRGNPGTSRDAPAPICRYWKSGHCSRKPCRFLHGDPAAPAARKKRNNTWVNTSSQIASPSPTTTNAAVPSVPPSTTKHRAEQAQQVPPPTKRHAEQDEQAPPPPKRGCRAQEQQKEPGGGSSAWCAGDGIRGVARLEGHAKAVTGVAVPEGSGGHDRP